jgi:cysteine synthase A
MTTHPIFPTFEEMLHPQRVGPELRAQATRARDEAPLDPINFFNIHWRRPDDINTVNYLVMPHALTGVDAQIVVLIAKDFPTGSHKVGPAYSVLIENTCRARSSLTSTRWSSPAPATMALAGHGLGRGPASRAW